MKTVNPASISKLINRCYMDYDPGYPKEFGQEDLMNAFKNYLENDAGIKLEFRVEIKEDTGRLGYGMKRVEIVDEPKYTLWLIKWS